MWGVKICVCRGAAVFSPWSRITQPSIPKTFNILNLTTKYSSVRSGAAQSFNLLRKPSSKFDVLCRKVVTPPVANQSIPVQKIIGTWLLICSGMVYGAIMLGGYTRLTESGLSMVKWNFTYEKLPTSEEEWVEEFKKYQEYPEYKQLKRDLTLEEFKTIFMNEYIHRNWGRLTGLVFCIPATAFWVKGYFLPKMKIRAVVFALLIGAQGLMGWYMVKSGLEDRFHDQADIPRVSQYRLAAHLGLALTLFSGTLWTALDLLLPAQKISVTAGARKIKMLAYSCKGLVFLTALSGAFVAGLDAGLVYNSFPKMGNKWIPEDILALSPKFKNFTENPTTVQFDHRILGLTTVSLITIMWFMSRRHILPPRAKVVMNLLTIMAFLQVSLGISTLIHHVPISEAVSHQTGSVVLLSLALWLSHELKHLKYVPK